MQHTSNDKEIQENEQRITNRINWFFQQFTIGALAHRCVATGLDAKQARGKVHEIGKNLLTCELRA